MYRKILVRHIIVIWDESDHVSPKRSARLASRFWQGYLTAFPEANQTTESPTIVSTSSPMFSPSKVRSFFHDGSMIPYEGRNKDLAIAKFCAAGFLDQDEVFHSLIDEMRRMRHRNGDPPMHADESTMVVFFTSDNASGMARAIKYVMDQSTHTRTHLSIGLLSKDAVSGPDRLLRAGGILGTELKKRLIKIQDGGILLEVEK